MLTAQSRRQCSQNDNRPCSDRSSRKNPFGDSFSHLVNAYRDGPHLVNDTRQPGAPVDRLPVPDRHVRGRSIPQESSPVGYAALIGHFDLATPLPPRLPAIATRHHPSSTSEWLLLTPRHRPTGSLAGQLAFALKWEGIDLGVLASLFAVVDAPAIAEIVRATPTGAFSRRLWFLYEWLTGRDLDIPDPGKVKAVPVVDSELQYALSTGLPSSRHKVRDNLPRTRRFCPMVRKSAALRAAGRERYGDRAREVIDRTRTDLAARATAFLLVKDTKSSFAIEGERISGTRMTRWARAVAQAGSQPLSIEELLRLQKLVIGDSKFVRPGLRDEGGFVGIHDRRTGEPVPDHVSARHQDLSDLLQGLVDYDRRAGSAGLDPVVAAAVLAFGFVYIHPFEDGNGRVHRWLFHHVLMRTAYGPPGVVFPISSAIERRIDAYKAVLESYTAELLATVDWKPTASRNIQVLNDTADYYRNFDATAHAEFLYDCIAQTIKSDLPEEIAFLKAHDLFSENLKSVVDMPNRQVELLRRFLAQNAGRLSKRARMEEFAHLTEVEVAQVEAIFAAAFDRPKT